MPTPYAGTNTFPATVDVVDDGDAASASGIAAPALEGLADRTIFLRDRDRVVWADGRFSTVDSATNSTSFSGDLTNYGFDLGALEVGDVITFHAIVGHKIANVAALSLVTITILDVVGATSNHGNFGASTGSTTTVVAPPIFYTFKVVTAGDHEVYLSNRTTDAAHASTIDYAEICVSVFRAGV